MPLLRDRRVNPGNRLVGQPLSGVHLRDAVPEVDPPRQGRVGLHGEAGPDPQVAEGRVRPPRLPRHARLGLRWGGLAGLGHVGPELEEVAAGDAVGLGLEGGGEAVDGEGEEVEEVVAVADAETLLVELGAHVPAREVEDHLHEGQAEEVDQGHRALVLEQVAGRMKKSRIKKR